MNKKMWITIGLAVLLILAGLFTFWRYEVANREAIASMDITDLSNTYNADEEKQKGIESLEKGIAPAKLIQANPAAGQKVALVFDGLPDRPGTARLLDVLKKHKARAVFFVEGQNAANQPETIKLIVKDEQEIGNYTFIGLSHIERLSQEDVLSQLCLTQKIITVLSNKAPVLFRGPACEYTPSLLQTVAAAGISYAVQSTVALPKNAIHTVADADAFVQGLTPGCIISVPTGMPVDAITMKSGKTDERPAFDKKPTIHDDRAASNTPREDIADEVDRLLTALEQRGYTTEFADTLETGFSVTPVL